MSDKVYEMDDDYNRAMTELVECIKIRDELADEFHLVLPENRNEARSILDAMNKKIEQMEAALAKEYESFQALRRAEEVRDAAFDEMFERVVKSYIHIKYNHPDIEPEVKEKALAVWEGREEQFHDRVAMYENDKTEFEKIIARAETK